MKVKCLLHGHKWEDCICSRCGQMRNENHVWDGCICKKCGAKASDNALHDWELINQEYTESESDEWYGGHFVSMTSVTEVNIYRCRNCGLERQDVHSGIR